MSLIVFKNNLKAIMEERHLSQNSLAKMSGLSPGCISRFMTYPKRSSVTADTIERLSKALNISMDALYKNPYMSIMVEVNEVPNDSDRDRPVI